jgi:rubrerythrin
MLTREQLLKAIEGEQNAIADYERIKTLTDDTGQITVLNGIIMDEHKHLRNFEELYRRKFGSGMVSPPLERPRELGFTESLRSAVNDEIEAYEFYRDLYMDCTNDQTRQIFFGAMTDENEHAMRLLLMLIPA